MYYNDTEAGFIIQYHKQAETLQAQCAAQNGYLIALSHPDLHLHPWF